MRRVLVTGANKGIGLAIVEAILTEHSDTFVYLASRDLERGRAAAAELTGRRGDLGDRLEVVALDVADDLSVSEARGRVAASLGKDKLYGIVNNAGIGLGSGDLAAILQTNTLGVHRVCEAFLPLVQDGGRVVNVTSASGPIFVASCRADLQRFFLDGAVTWPRLAAFIDDCSNKRGDATTLPATALDGEGAYGLSKALANTYTLLLARENPRLAINACTPGFIATDMTRRYADAERKSPAELGMKTPAEGAKAPMHLLFGKLEGNGWYYGSDAKRSPLDRYRAPGSAEHTGP